MAKKTSEATRSNSDIVREILDSGIEKPAEIETVAIEKYLTTIGKPLINQVKMAWKKSKGPGSSGGKVAAGGLSGGGKTTDGGVDGGGKTTDSTGAHGGGKTTTKGVDHGNPKTKGQDCVAPSDLELAKLALRAGGVSQLVAQIENLLK